MKNPIVQAQKWFASRGTKRSPQWAGVRQTHLVLEPWCRGCGGTINLEVHHIKSFHEHPDLELDRHNLLTLCERAGFQCHLKKGHLGNWKKINPHVTMDATMPRPQTM